MAILSYQSIKQCAHMITPMCERTRHKGMTYGLGPAGYDVRIKQDVILPPGTFSLASTIEAFDMPDDVLALVKDKSTWARQGLSVFNTVIEPGWRGFLTLELKNHGHETLFIDAGMPIAQILFFALDMKSQTPYGDGKYQDQGNRPVEAILDNRIQE